MRIGVFGRERDPHCVRLTAALAERGAETVLIDLALDSAEHRASIRADGVTLGGQSLHDISVFFVRSVVSPIPHVHAVGEHMRLYDEWHVQYMRSRETHGFAVAFLLALEAGGAKLVNPVECGQIGQLKPHHTLELIRGGFPLPPTLITSNPREALEFIAEHGETIYKPVMGGALTRAVTADILDRIELIENSPIILQKLIRGEDIRVTLTEDQILSACIIKSDALDFRGSTGYETGGAVYEPVELPEEIREMCFAALRTSGYRFSGIDLKRSFPNDYYLLECNYAPAYAEIEDRTGHRISQGIADYLLRLASGGVPQPCKSESFIDYSGNFLPRKATQKG